MTRDEAIAALVNVDASTAIYAGGNEKLVDKLVAIGVLELDEPMTEIELLSVNSGCPEWRLKTVLSELGLKVVRA